MRLTLGDDGVLYRACPKDADGNILSNIISATLVWRRSGTQNATIRTMTVTQDPVYKLEYIFAASDFIATGPYDARINITLTTGQTVSSKRKIPIIIEL